jgi:ribosome modulation factor
MFGQLYELAKADGEKAFADGYKDSANPHTDENLKQGWQHGWENADRDAQDAEYRQTKR